MSISEASSLRLCLAASKAARSSFERNFFSASSCLRLASCSFRSSSALSLFSSSMRFFSSSSRFFSSSSRLFASSSSSSFSAPSKTDATIDLEASLSSFFSASFSRSFFAPSIIDETKDAEASSNCFFASSSARYCLAKRSRYSFAIAFRFRCASVFSSSGTLSSEFRSSLKIRCMDCALLFSVLHNR